MRHCAKDIRKKLVAIAMKSVPGPLNGYHKMRHTQQSLVRINWNFGTKGKIDFLIAV